MTDAERIASLGGPAKLAELLGFKKPGSTQRVSNWKSRGIPPAVKLQRPDLFLRYELVTADHPAPTESDTSAQV